jgi:hypothetical protein
MPALDRLWDDEFRCLIGFPVNWRKIAVSLIDP